MRQQTLGIIREILVLGEIFMKAESFQMMQALIKVNHLNKSKNLVRKINPNLMDIKWKN